MTTNKKTKPELKIQIQGIPWRVRFLTSKQMKKVFPEMALLGLTDPAKQIIYVDRERNWTTVTATLWHEIFHAMVASLQGSIDSNEGAIQEEAAANLVGNAMIELLPFIPKIEEMVKEVSIEDEDEV